MRTTLPLFLFSLWLSPAMAQKKSRAPATLPLYTVDTVKGLFRDVVRELHRAHPGFYRYRDSASMHHDIENILSGIDTPMTEINVYRRLKPVFSSIGCLHTDLSLSPSTLAYLNQFPNLLPLQLYFTGGKAFIIKNYSDSSNVQPGDELLSINGQPVDSILKVLLPAIPSDGYNLTMKYLTLYHQFPLWYRSMISADTHFDITVERNGQMYSSRLAGLSYPALSADGYMREPKHARQLSFHIAGGTGFLTIRSFAVTDIRKNGQRFRSFIDSVFHELKEKQVKHLILDIRYNTGGTDPNAVYLARHFFNKPFRYWDKITVTPGIAG